MPEGKVAGERCVHLDPENRCRIFGQPERPRFCAELAPSEQMCGDGPAEAMRILERLEQLTRPDQPSGEGG
jgi:Fe-S-cluster containining protein